ncbi:MAG: glutamine--tRNA ligase/YqeY domain fusion protein [Candidatus Nitrohelix vancouverensis]|uniref:Glutamine--tRNA ligase n=1 Tax=Candidatus Nitrohelix vancouverensis TaxID=2705534 RepID=A0A7T0G3K6_9BACT|nr:MAG: glutamine--tRNA ligase/YqeY domain fusion protein [Candidatus Nitrohelix vancouverensis]
MSHTEEERPSSSAEGSSGSHFIRQIIKQDNESGKFGGRVHTRFPPEPNGYLHIGHAKSICLNFGLAQDLNGVCNLRFDDTNPAKEEQAYVEAIQEDLRWLGFDWKEPAFFASDYFEQLYEFALQLIRKGSAYVDDLSPDEIREYRGTLSEPGRESPFRNRPVEESLDLFARMKSGEFEGGSRSLRAKIDMKSGNLNMRDPVMYRILKASHHRTGTEWSVYPMYDFAHGLCDSLENITHSLCTLEFEDHRPLYDWFLDQLEIYHPQQIEFARLNLNYTVLSKRKLLKMVQEKMVDGWNDPRMPTISGLRRRGYTPSAIRDFCERIGVSKSQGTVDVALLEHCAREDLNKSAARVMAVLNPLKVELINYPEGETEELVAENNPEDPEAGSRSLPFSRTLYIEQDDFMEDPPKKFFRLGPGREVRLKHAYIIKCEEVVKDEAGNITVLRCSYDPDSKSGGSNAGRKVKGTLHWVSAEHAVDAEVRLYDRLFLDENPGDEKVRPELKDAINPESMQTLQQCKVEPSLAQASPESRYQFLRLGYFCADQPRPDGVPVFNRTVTLRDTWGKILKQGS